MRRNVEGNKAEKEVSGDYGRDGSFQETTALYSTETKLTVIKKNVQRLRMYAPKQTTCREDSP